MILPHTASGKTACLNKRSRRQDLKLHIDPPASTACNRSLHLFYRAERFVPARIFAGLGSDFFSARGRIAQPPVSYFSRLTISLRDEIRDRGGTTPNGGHDHGDTSDLHRLRSPAEPHNKRAWHNRLQ